MTGTLQKVIDETRVAVAAVAYAGEWAEVDSGEDLNSYIELHERRT